MTPPTLHFTGKCLTLSTTCRSSPRYPGKEDYKGEKKEKEEKDHNKQKKENRKSSKEKQAKQ